MLSYLQSLLPETNGGKLPYWLLFISVVSAFNSVQTYQDISLTKRVYEKDPGQVSPLSARTFGTWTLITSIVRLYGAYHLNVKEVYDLTQFTFVIAGWHFLSEWLYFDTCKLGKGLSGPLIVSTSSLIWMYLQKDYYLN
ncbi:Ergosterol biosynthetic protein 28 [Candida viswanathii]|uniref:Ergosterol biosynthetic protein 28 n=1 Tax=Candida viswanathii TaxID=5486 RepID=A0A367XML3_9ASCO|nr:Ergosterol biosynthetic protein 28 [Candida viswanathii]